MIAAVWCRNIILASYVWEAVATSTQDAMVYVNERGCIFDIYLYWLWILT